VEKERSRIARDIHDELGASLAQITLLSRLAREGLEDNSEVSRKLEDIAARAAGAGRQLAEIVWAINPARDSLEHLVGYLCGFAQEHLALAGVAFRTDIPEEFAAMPLESSARYNIFLAVRELIHNAVSHARPSVVYLRVRCEAVRLRVEVEDNGCGFDPGSVVPGRGLSNVRERMAQLAGEMVVCDVGGRGTCVVLSIPLQTSLRPEKNA
jgi:signal transduction histidine kinase